MHHNKYILYPCFPSLSTSTPHYNILLQIYQTSLLLYTTLRWTITNISNLPASFFYTTAQYTITNIPASTLHQYKHTRIYTTPHYTTPIQTYLHLHYTNTNIHVSTLYHITMHHSKHTCIYITPLQTYLHLHYTITNIPASTLHHYKQTPIYTTPQYNTPLQTYMYLPYTTLQCTECMYHYNHTLSSTPASTLLCTSNAGTSETYRLQRWGLLLYAGVV